MYNYIYLYIYLYIYIQICIDICVDTFTASLNMNETQITSRNHTLTTWDQQHQIVIALLQRDDGRVV